MKTELEKVIFVQSPVFQALPEKQIGILLNSSATPSVENLETWKAVNTIATNVTDFTKGSIAQHLRIRGDGFTTIVHNVAKIITNTGLNKLLAVNLVYNFTLFDNVWIEDV